MKIWTVDRMRIVIADIGPGLLGTDLADWAAVVVDWGSGPVVDSEGN